MSSLASVQKFCQILKHVLNDCFPKHNSVSLVSFSHSLRKTPSNHKHSPNAPVKLLFRIPLWNWHMQNQLVFWICSDTLPLGIKEQILLFFFFFSERDKSYFIDNFARLCCHVEYFLVAVVVNKISTSSFSSMFNDFLTPQRKSRVLGQIFSFLFSCVACELSQFNEFSGNQQWQNATTESQCAKERLLSQRLCSCFFSFRV